MRQEWDEDGVNYQLDFFYDTQGKPLAVIYRQNGNGLSYYYLTNQQGDVTKLSKPVPVTGSTTVNMVEIATYSYDPWGKATVTVNTGSQITNNDRTLASINPLRYRGYYQDVETGFYYLQSRYYDPVIGRFINADLPEYAALSATDITGTNLFAYCKNDPINHADEDGEWLNVVIGAVVGAVVGAAITAIESRSEDGSINWKSVAKSAFTGAVSGAISATGFGGVAGQMFAGGLSGVVDSLDDIRKYQKGEKSLGETLLTTAVNVGTGVLFSAAGYSGTGAFEESKRLTRGAISAAKTIRTKAANPGVKRAAKETINLFKKYAKRLFVHEGISGAVTGSISAGTRHMAKSSYRYYRRHGIL